MSKYIPTAYKPSELEAAIEALKTNRYHGFHENDAKGIVIALHNMGYRIIKTGRQE